MNLVGVILLVIGIPWLIWRLLKQREMVLITKRNKDEKGFLKALSTYIFSELFGLLPSLFFTYFGLKIIFPSILNAFLTAIFSILFFIFLTISGLI